MMKQSNKKIKAFGFSRKAMSYPYMLFMLVFIVVPLVLILINAFVADGQLTFDNFVSFFKDVTKLNTLATSLVVGFITTMICLLVGYPVALILSKFHAGNKILVLLFIMPMWVNFLIRTLATKAIFTALGIDLRSMGTAIFGMVYNYLPFMILPLHTALTSIDKSYSEAAQDLGCDKMQVFAKVTLPLSLPGVLSGVTMVFIPSISTFAITEILTENNIFLFGDDIAKMFAADMYGVGSVMSLVMLVFVVLLNIVMNKFGSEEARRSAL